MKEQHAEIDLKDHQEEAVAGALAVLDKEGRCKVIMACGTGKTFVAPAIAVQRAAHSVVVYLPSIALIRQTLREWIRMFDGTLHCLCVCSDDTVSKTNDSIIVSSDDLRKEVGDASVTTDAAVVHNFLAATNNCLRVVFATYHSCDVVSQGCPDGFWFDLGVFDEAHNTAGKDGKLFGLPLLDSHTRISKRVFMTATPKHLTYRKRKATHEAEPEVLYSMDNVLVYGKQAYTLSIRDAIRRGIIAEYKVLVTCISEADIPSHLLALNDNETIAHAIAIRKAVDEWGCEERLNSIGFLWESSYCNDQGKWRRIFSDRQKRVEENHEAM